jgi:hypothetical protein
MSKTKSPRVSHHLSGEAKAAIIAAVISALALLLVGWLQYKSKPKAASKFVGRLQDSNTETPVGNAKVSLEIQDVPPVVYSDSEGIFSFPLSDGIAELHLRIEANGYEKYDQRIGRSSVFGIQDIRLVPIKLNEGLILNEAPKPSIRPGNPRKPKEGSRSVAVPSPPKREVQLKKAVEELHAAPPNMNTSKKPN